jgi:hypothetical protein
MIKNGFAERNNMWFQCNDEQKNLINTFKLLNVWCDDDDKAIRFLCEYDMSDNGAVFYDDIESMREDYKRLTEKLIGEQ